MTDQLSSKEILLDPLERLYIRNRIKEIEQNLNEIKEILHDI